MSTVAAICVGAEHCVPEKGMASIVDFIEQGPRAIWAFVLGILDDDLGTQMRASPDESTSCERRVDLLEGGQAITRL
ncbi:hypothetical protein U1Q18_005714 [Sarracenia purpurea var. burkii]